VFLRLCVIVSALCVAGYWGALIAPVSAGDLRLEAPSVISGPRGRVAGRKLLHEPPRRGKRRSKRLPGALASNFYSVDQRRWTVLL
jgi:hypothetical protein